MKLEERLPRWVKVGRWIYWLKTDFRHVLRMYDILADKRMTDSARLYLALCEIVKNPPRDEAKQIAVYIAARAALTPEKGGGNSDGVRVTDFVQDADMIRTAFRQVYGIDLFRAKLHWIEFTELLNNLPSGTRYSEIIEIRAKPLPEATKWNGKERTALIEAKARYAIEKSEDEIRRSYSRGVNNLANSLLKMAGEGSGGHG